MATDSIRVLLFVSLWLSRYLRLIVNTISFMLLKPIPVPIDPNYLPSDVTVIVPTTFTQLEDLFNCLKSIIACSAKEIIMVTSNAKLLSAKEFCTMNKFHQVKVIGVQQMGKRIQMTTGLQIVSTKIVAFADDDVIWPKGYVPHFLAPFENPEVGAVGTNQRVVRDQGQGLWSNMWNILAIGYLERRTFLTGAVNKIDGGMSTLSGRTAVYRAEILQDTLFYNAFQNDCWRGQRLNGDDDKFLTKWTYSHGWKIHYQYSNDMPLMTTLETTSAYLKQCLRWARGHWRGNFNVMRSETYWYRVHLWTLYATYLASFQTPALAVDYLMFKLLSSCVEGHPQKTTAIYIMAVWVVFAKAIKMIPHFCRHPSDVRFFPVLLAFSYFHGFINLYALCTMKTTGWGSRPVDPTPTNDSSFTDNSNDSTNDNVATQLVIPSLLSAVHSGYEHEGSLIPTESVNEAVNRANGYDSSPSSSTWRTNQENQSNDLSRRRRHHSVLKRAASDSSLRS